VDRPKDADQGTFKCVSHVFDGAVGSNGDCLTSARASAPASILLGDDAMIGVRARAFFSFLEAPVLPVGRVIPGGLSSSGRLPGGEPLAAGLFPCGAKSSAVNSSSF